VVSDSCFSGTVTRGVATGLPVSLAAPVAAGPRSLSPELRERRLDAALSNALYHRDFVATYQPRRIETSVFRGTEAHAHIVLLAACQDDQTAAESAEHGIFTDALLTIWKDGEFVGTHREFIQRIAQETGERQRPDLYCTGAPNDAFVNSRPFKPDAIAQEIPSSEPLGSELPGGTPCRSR